MRFEFYDINGDIHTATRGEELLMIVCTSYTEAMYHSFKGGERSVKPKLPTEMLYRARIVVSENSGILTVHKCNIANPNFRTSKKLRGFFDGLFDNHIDTARAPGSILISTLLEGTKFPPDSIIESIRTGYAFRRSILLL